MINEFNDQLSTINDQRKNVLARHGPPGPKSTKKRTRNADYSDLIIEVAQ